MLDIIFSWNTVWWILVPIYVLCCIGLIIVVLLQKGKGVGFAGAFGAGPGGGDAVFGPRSSKSLPQKITYSMAGIFMLIALILSMLSGNVGTSVAPELVPDTGVEPVVTGGGGSMDALFGNTPASTPSAATKPVEDTSDTAAPATENTPVAPVETPAVETPAESAAPAVAETPAPAESPAVEVPVPEAPAAPAAQ